MSLEEAGYGAGGGLLIAALSWFGLRERINHVENDMTNVKNAVVYKDTCGICHSATNQRLDRIEQKIDRLLEKK